MSAKPGLSAAATHRQKRKGPHVLINFEHAKARFMRRLSRNNNSLQTLKPQDFFKTSRRDMGQRQNYSIIMCKNVCTIRKQIFYLLHVSCVFLTFTKTTIQHSCFYQFLFFERLTNARLISFVESLALLLLKSIELLLLMPP